MGGEDEEGGRRVGLAAVVLLLLGTFGVSTAYGMLLLLPLYVHELGGDEADFGVVLSAATVTAATPRVTGRVLRRVSSAAGPPADSRDKLFSTA